jgi:hypothetical protein
LKATSQEIAIHLATLRQTPLHISSVAEQLSEEQLRVRPLPKDWSLVDHLAHLLACAEIWGDDIERMLGLDTPRFEKPHPNNVMRQHQMPPFAESARAFADLRTGLIARLQALDPNQWERSAIINGRHHTVYTQTRRTALHEAVHADQIREACRVRAELEPRAT